ncbi:pilus assembly PilX N-terminal domain-containing protein [Shewanella xiamenensis]|uniref:pilus assembly PilX family protein n=1 Tax=Shewanella TaxID=22 RepID=UPI000647D14B|nr:MULTISPECIES: pilus assembly PilX N-terminal domain-containing protein [Shewanella]MCH7424381.1 pilus assembly PilX N-terminal domain-containing protein [Shewanella sp. MM_2022_3]MCT8870003.1 pilus assembly PilX N-terminal domain-containing protein [Shewanella xiamenensis]MDL3984219.1 pilus assembly PilX N-terminal domain-containing protein [Shewanella xiamenensis]NSM23536.1 pilus assembly PilX N-terminal domain-containing protein [Shewanella sp. ZOR0012]QRK80533.1 pilus assembly PilX N-ter
MRKQKGIVLFFALIVLLLMTIIGVALAVNSTQSMRMSGAGSERIEAKAIADGGLEAVLEKVNKEKSLTTLSNIMTATEFGSLQTLTPSPFEVDAAGNVVVGAKDVECQRNSKPTPFIDCRRVEIRSTANFGRDNLGQLTVIMLVEQEVIAGTGG